MALSSSFLLYKKYKKYTFYNNICKKISTFATVMTFVESLLQVKAFARQDGVIMALLWTASFVMIMLYPKSSIGSLLALATPLVLGWRLVKYRNYALNGMISFGKALAYSCFTIFYASALFALVQYVYFRFLDHGNLSTMLVESLKTLEAVYGNNSEYVKSVKDSISLIMGLKPIQLSFIIMMQNIFIGCLMGLPIALLCKSSKPLRTN